MTTVSSNQPDRSVCTPCRGTGVVLSAKGGTQHQITCPWCGGDGKFHPGRDAQAELVVQAAAAG
ncbi:MAG: hypothetical protein ACP5H2_08040 [Solirubrobacteraceae bacterium]